MLALIMAGGEGSRLRMGEKPLVTICDRPMIAYVIDAFRSCGHEVMVVTSRRTPYTRNWCRAHSIPHFPGHSGGYVEDLDEAIRELEETGPVFTAVADLPCITPEIVERVEHAFSPDPRPACSVWLPEERAARFRTRYHEVVDGVCACPAGINILTGALVPEEQDELRLLIDEPRLAYNVNTRQELEAVTHILCPKISR